MSAIGNYVHYTAAGYNKTGTNTQRQKPSISASQALALQKQDIHNRILGYQQVSEEALQALKTKIQELVDKIGNVRK